MTLEQLLEKHGPMTTSHASTLLQKSGVSSTAARQRISRRNPQVRTLHGLPFPKRARFIYLERDFGTDRYWSALIDAIKSANPAYAAALGGILARGGMVPKQHFSIMSGSPVKQRGQLASSVVLKRLRDAGLVNEVEVDGIGTCILLPQVEERLIPQVVSMRAQLLTEGVLLDAIRSWVGKMNLCSPNVVRIRGDQPDPQYGTCCFDLSGPSYLKPLLRITNSSVRHGFFVADVLLGQELTAPMVSAFLRKCTLLSNLRGLGPYLPMLIGESFTLDSLKACRGQGIITTTPETLFGIDVARALADLLQTLTHASSATPSKIETLFSRLSAVEGAAGNLRGALFELIVGHCVQALEGGDLTLGFIVFDNERNKKAEIDVRLVKQKSVTVYECKGYQPSSLVKVAEIESWLENKVPTIFRALRQEQRFANSSVRFEFWTCGEFDKESLDLLKSKAALIGRYEIGWRSGREVLSYIDKMQSSGLKKIFKEHYLEHPLAVKSQKRSKAGSVLR